MKKTGIYFILFLTLLIGNNVALSEEAVKGKVVDDKNIEIKTQVVRIQGYEGVFPLNIYIKPGTVVVWVNQYHGTVGIKFPDKKVTIACKSPVNFSVNDEGEFVSNPIDYGAVASLCFIEPGTYNYFMERSTPSRRQKTSDHFRFEGKIVVK